MDNLITLSMKELQRYEVAQKLIKKQISEDEARKSMGLKSVRQVRRIKQKVIKDGAQGIIHKSRGKASNRKLKEEFIKEVMQIINEKYHDFKPTFAAEKLLENHNLRINKESLRQLMIKEKLWKPKSRKRPKQRHTWRPRRSNYGEMQQFDGSYHKWFEDRGEEACLLVSIDDATSKITEAKFDKNEGVVAVFKFWLQYFKKNGLPLSIYLDKFSTYKINHKLAVDNKDLLTQFQRAMKQVGIETITAHSPQAKGRVERAFGTLQDRLTKELKLANISSIKEANQFLKTYIPKFNQKFSVVPKNQANLHKEIDKQTEKKLPQIFSRQLERKVNNDYTIMFENGFYQLNEIQPTTVFKKDTVIMEKHLNEEIKICLNGHYLKYEVLPERPKKQNIKLCALTRQKSGYIPPKDHIWRKFNYSTKSAQKNKLELTSV